MKRSRAHRCLVRFGRYAVCAVHYPFENRGLIESGEQHPADFICEASTRPRGWFYSLHAIGTFLFDKPAYRAVMVNELILDREGQKMSKSKGNSVNPSTSSSATGLIPPGGTW